MITPKVTGAIITTIVIAAGTLMLLPALMVEKKFPIQENPDNYLILLTFNIVNSSNMPSWCYDLSNFLKDEKIHSTVFITGTIANTYPECILRLSNDTDIGSMSYSYDRLASTPTYSGQLDQIKMGKDAIDSIGKFNSTLFRAPYGAVDDNIYSLLSRSHIIADFRYTDHYNVFTNGLSGMTFYRNPIVTISNLSQIQNANPTTQVPIMINFYNYDTINNLESIIKSKSGVPHQFISASELTDMSLTKQRR